MFQNHLSFQDPETQNKILDSSYVFLFDNKLPDLNFNLIGTSLHFSTVWSL